jgi:hypothetical protein
VTPNTAMSLWDRLVVEFIQANTTLQSYRDFFQAGIDRVGMVREALEKGDGNHRATAVALIQKMPGYEQERLLPELVQLARAAHGPVGAIRGILVSLPRDWVLANIDAEVDKGLTGEEYDDYWMFLELLAELDLERARQLAHRAAAHSDPEIRELGLEKLAEFSHRQPERADP